MTRHLGAGTFRMSEIEDLASGAAQVKGPRFSTKGCASMASARGRRRRRRSLQPTRGSSTFVARPPHNLRVAPYPSSNSDRRERVLGLRQR